jgi:superfamily I DNA/RNA helicase
MDLTVPLTGAQQAVVDHVRGPVIALGGPGTGKTTALVSRYVEVVRSHPPNRLLVLVRDRLAAERFRAAVIPFIGGAHEDVAITTAHGLAYNVVARTDGPVRLLTNAEQRAALKREVTLEAGTAAASQWPTLHSLLNRPAFVDDLVRAVLHLRAAMPATETVLERARIAGVAPRWEELLAFADRYTRSLEQAGCVDGAGLMRRAAAILSVEGLTSFDHVIVDDYEATAVVAATLLDVLLELRAVGMTFAVAGDLDAYTAGHDGRARLAALSDAWAAGSVVHFERSFRAPDRPELVQCRHPSTEPEAIAAELLAASADGVPWTSMAVLVRRPGPRTRSIARALSRHRIPLVPDFASAAEEPAVQGIIEMLLWAAGDESAFDRLLSSPLAGLDADQIRGLRRRARIAGERVVDQPEIAHLLAVRDEVVAGSASAGPAQLGELVFRRLLGHLVHAPGAAPPHDDRILDAIVAFLDGLDRRGQTGGFEALEGIESAVDPWRVQRVRRAGVTIATIASAAGQEWDTVLLAGCVEGELPDVRAPEPFFDAGIASRSGPHASGPERLGARLAEERRLFHLACTRATRRLTATAGPEPGVLISRFVESWPLRDAVVPVAPIAAPRALEPSSTTVVWPDGRLQLSATQLDTYADCPLKYGFRYALRVQSDSTVWADFGTLVHAILADFLDPANPAVRTRERLLDLAERHWRDEIARYQPQRDEARRDLFEILDLWWQREGDGPAAPEVLAVEHGFDIDVGPHRVTGSIDRVDRASDGHGIRLVDYKTGRVAASEKEVADHIQLATYYLAALRDPVLAGFGPPTELRLLFLRTMEARDQPIGAEHALRTETRILEAASEILAEKFDPSVQADCDHCEFHRLCPLQPEGREVA